MSCLSSMKTAMTPQTDVMPGEVGSGSWEPSLNPSCHRAQPQLDEDEGEEFDYWEDNYDYPEEEQLSGGSYRVSVALEEANKVFLRTSRARGSSPGWRVSFFFFFFFLDGGFQMHYENTPFEQLVFIKELFSLMIVNRLTKELGCD
ncbi:unnamed protein product [Nyctereutes procyonoides]|uniref:(raccoon dog) hypothetical protein n=1 Tax=Nyctereutes procyonoides TaxID=34880 RepID=A0A811ZGM0_NYCPR|nr:unnamed protein product [Nyctereutes procyonoides]